MPVLTRQAWWLITLTIFTIAVAFIFRSNYLLTFTAATFVAMNLVVLAWAYLAVRGLEIEREHSDTAIEGNPLRVRLKVSNPGRMGRVNLSLFDVFTPAVDEDEELVEIPLDSLEPESSTELEYTDRPARRGEYELGPLYVAGGDPFGIYNVFRKLDSYSELLVLPSPVELHLPATGARSELPKRESGTRSREGESQEFFGVREFRKGDSTRQIHWRLTARRGDLIARQYELNVASSLNLVLVENFPSERSRLKPEHDALEMAVKAATSLASAATERGYQLSVMRLSPDHDEYTTGFGESNYQRALRVLVKVEGEGEFSLPPLTAGVTDRLPREGVTVWLAATPPDSDWEALSYLPATFASSAFLVFDRESFDTREPLGEERIRYRQGLLTYSLGYGDDLKKHLTRFVRSLQGYSLHQTSA